MIAEQFDKLIPFISENFITYPLWEEGKYIPFLNFWQITETFGDYERMREELNGLVCNIGYEVINDSNEKNYKNQSRITTFSIYPSFEPTEDGGYKVLKEDWSIEEMIDIIEKYIKSKKK